MTTELKATLVDHAVGNYRVLMNLSDELLTLARSRAAATRRKALPRGFCAAHAEEGCQLANAETLIVVPAAPASALLERRLLAAAPELATLALLDGLWTSAPLLC